MKMASIMCALSRQAVAILRELLPLTAGGAGVPSLRSARPADVRCHADGRPFGGWASRATRLWPHGFRASARTLMDEVLGERVDLIEHLRIK